MVEKLPIKSHSSVLDPACGAGAFLTEVLGKKNNDFNGINHLAKNGRKYAENCNLAQNMQR